MIPFTKPNFTRQQAVENILLTDVKADVSLYLDPDNISLLVEQELEDDLQDLQDDDWMSIGTYPGIGRAFSTMGNDNKCSTNHNSDVRSEDGCDTEHRRTSEPLKDDNNKNKVCNKTESGNDDSDKKPLMSDGHPQSRIRHLMVAGIVVASTASIIMCAIVVTGVYCGHQHMVRKHDVVVSIPCDDISTFYTVAKLYHHTDEVTNHRFKAEGIRRVKNKKNNVVSCELPLTSLMARMSREEYDIVEGKAKLNVDQTGPTLDHSRYNLSITDTDLRGIDADRQTLIVMHEGYYFIYFGIQLSYEGDSSCKTNRFKTSISHLLVRESISNQYRVLLGSEHTCCVTCVTEAATDHTGGLFHLKPNDQVFIQVSSPKNVGHADGNYLGMIRLTSLN